MSKRAYIHRYWLIIKKLKVKPYSSYEELQVYIDNQLEFLQLNDDTLNMGFSIRTLQRDIKEIRNIFGIDIEYSKKNKGYFISQNEMENINFQRMMEAFDMFNSLNLAQDLAPFIHLEKRRPQGTENLYGLMHAIKNKFIIHFTYEKFWEDTITERTVQPYTLREFENRWYLMVKEGGFDYLKCFGLDRISNLDITNKKFTPEKHLNTEEHFRYCFGIMVPEDDEGPQDVILSFHPEQGKYIKTLPLHHTQQILVDDGNEIRIKLKLYTTFDFTMKLLSYGELVKVIQPQSLIEEIRTAHENAFKKYK